MDGVVLPVEEKRGTGDLVTMTGRESGGGCIVKRGYIWEGINAVYACGVTRNHRFLFAFLIRFCART